MKWSEAFAVSVFIVCVALFLGVAIPGCIEKGDKARLSCIQAGQSPLECRRAFSR